jgi:transcription termination factor Rho
MSRGGPDTWEGTHVSESTATTPSTGSETATEASGTSTATKQRRGSGLSGMLLPELKQMAGGLGIKGAGGMRKSQLVDAIKAAQSGGQSGGASGASQSTSQPSGRTDRAEKPETAERPADGAQQARNENNNRSDNRGDNRRDNRNDRGNDGENRNDRGDDGDNRNRNDGGNRNKGGSQGNQGGNQGGQGNQGNQGSQGSQGNRNDDGAGSGRRNRRRRGRDRNDRSGGGGGGGANRGNRNEPDTTILEDDVLVPAAGILDVLDNYAFVRTSGYLPGSEDVYVSLSMVRKYGLRRGDAVTGQVRQPREGDRKEKFNPLVRIDTVNGADPEAAKSRIEFQKLTPLYASERLRLETESSNLIGRVIDIAAPIGKGQRGLIVSPSKAGKTMIMQSIANSITTNNPECHLMVVLVDERPEEVTDFERSVKGEVISSTFDRPASDHTAVAELAIERAKRLVELGHDVVVLLDGITRLGRAYNLAAPASGRILSGGVDSAALYPPKKFFGAARNIEDGGSLTILATALIESGSKMDEVIFEEFKGTGNMEIRLRRDFADKRIFPAIDAVQSGTRREELLMSKEELSIVWKLRRVLSGLDGQQALELLLERLKKSTSNIEFLTQVQKTTPIAGNGRSND